MHSRLGIIPEENPRWPWTMGIVLFGLLTALACMRYLALRSTVFDLGVFVCNLTAMSQGGEWWRALNGHIQPVLWGYSWLIRPLPDWLQPLGLMVAQAFMLSLPLPAIASRYGVFPALAYFGFFAVWHNGLFDFHPDHLAVPIGFWFFFMVRAGRPWAAALAALCLCLIKETFAIQAAACGLYLVGCRRGGAAGAFVFVAGLAWFWVSTAKLIPFYTMDAGVGASAGAFAWIGGASVLGKIWWVLTHPFSVLGQVFGDPGKLKYLLALFGSLAFVPLLSPGPLVVAAPVLALSLLSERPDYYSFANHYTAGLVAPFLAAFAQGLPVAVEMIHSRRARLDRWAGILLLVLLAGHMALAPSPLSVRFWRAGGFSGYWPDARDTRIIRTLEQTIPDDPAVTVITQNSLNWGKVVSRYFSNSFPMAVFEPHRAQNPGAATLRDFRHFVLTGEKPDFPVTQSLAQYVVLDLKRPWYVVDKGCDWDGAACRDQEVAARFRDDLERARQDFDTLVDDDGFLILKRRTP
ncbi:hypothetical protein NNJEOMEG_02508 [Fundidesulfovibrio magnetotacticus]|uniref:DUF2079 domain-containing protein n=1 Tax=Fundidesulfovibrio magnetotacticus TaxID=2730080 RepID=A0A6V8LVP3_9BACT|nr:DUF2079 domain-containing protein [Fundidesulfovibrio magnetotacticus]GFK94661.1 hypothetical protein NNJEOMEG_02508 [Fundidesulfovibrio magnetotacticus]